MEKIDKLIEVLAEYLQDEAIIQLKLCGNSKSPSYVDRS